MSKRFDPECKDCGGRGRVCLYGDGMADCDCWKKFRRHMDCRDCGTPLRCMPGGGSLHDFNCPNCYPEGFRPLEMSIEEWREQQRRPAMAKGVMDDKEKAKVALWQSRADVMQALQSTRLFKESWIKESFSEEEDKDTLESWQMRADVIESIAATKMFAADWVLEHFTPLSEEERTEAIHERWVEHPEEKLGTI